MGGSETILHEDGFFNFSIITDDPLYRGYVRPVAVAEYASQLWFCGVPARDTGSLDRLQAKVARRYLYRKGCAAEWSTSKSELFRAAGLESLSWRRHIGALCLVFNVIKFHPHLLRACHFSLSSSARRPFYLLFASAQGPYRSRHVLSHSLAVWNNLPKDLREIAHAHTFKRDLKRQERTQTYAPDRSSLKQTNLEKPLS